MNKLFLFFFEHLNGPPSGIYTSLVYYPTHHFVCTQHLNDFITTDNYSQVLAINYQSHLKSFSYSQIMNKKYLKKRFFFFYNKLGKKKCQI